MKQQVKCSCRPSKFFWLIQKTAFLNVSRQQNLCSIVIWVGGEQAHICWTESVFWVKKTYFATLLTLESLHSFEWSNLFRWAHSKFGICIKFELHEMNFSYFHTLFYRAVSPTSDQFCITHRFSSISNSLWCSSFDLPANISRFISMCWLEDVKVFW